MSCDFALAFAVEGKNGGRECEYFDGGGGMGSRFAFRGVKHIMDGWGP